MLSARHRKCFRANIYKIAEDNLAFVRDGEGFSDGIICQNFDIEVSLVFEEKSHMLWFQSALLLQIAQTTSSKRPRYASEAKLPSENEDDDDEENGDREVLEIEIADETLSAAPPMIALKRVFRFHYMHIAGETLNSPLCNTFSDAGTMSNYEPETVPLSLEMVGQMIENCNHEFFVGKNPEVAHIKDKAKCSSSEEKDENNYLYLSRHVREAFDGINTVPTKFPWFLIHYVSHDNQQVDFGALRLIFGNDLPASDRTRKYQRTIVHIEFYNVVQAHNYSKYLRNNCHRVEASSDFKWEMELFFPDASKAKKYLDWKEKKTREIWS